MLTISNLRKFCKDNNLDRANLMRVLQGKSYQHRGWHLASAPQEALDDIVKFLGNRKRTLIYKNVISPDGKIYTIDVMNRFCESHNLRSGHMRSLMKGTRNHHKGWKVI